MDGAEAKIAGVGAESCQITLSSTCGARRWQKGRDGGFRQRDLCCSAGFGWAVSIIAGETAKPNVAGPFPCDGISFDPRGLGLDSGRTHLSAHTSSNGAVAILTSEAA